MKNRARKRVGRFAIDNFFRNAARMGRLMPMAKPSRHHVEIIEDLPYRDTGLKEHRLDIYRPTETPGPWPIVLYMHGGGFRILSKETHWVMGLAFARRGYLLMNLNYRLAPAHAFPAAVEDICAAYAWALKHGSEYGGDPSRVIVAGESAGANLATTLAVMSCYRREEPFAKELFELDRVPAAVLPTCGILQVSDVERFQRNGKVPAWIFDRMEEVRDLYLPSAKQADDRSLADPLLILESDLKPDRPLPPFFAGVGTRDYLIGDTKRLKLALDRLEVDCETRYYQGEVHAFNAFIWRRNARVFWQDTFDFLDAR